MRVDPSDAPSRPAPLEQLAHHPSPHAQVDGVVDEGKGDELAKPAEQRVVADPRHHLRPAALIFAGVGRLAHS